MFFVFDSIPDQYKTEVIFDIHVSLSQGAKCANTSNLYTTHVGFWKT